MNTNKFFGYLMYASGVANLVIGCRVDNWIIVLFGVAGILWGASFLSLEDESQNKEEE